MNRKALLAAAGVALTLLVGSGCTRPEVEHAPSMPHKTVLEREAKAVITLYWDYVQINRWDKARALISPRQMDKEYDFLPPAEYQYVESNCHPDYVGRTYDIVEFMISGSNSTVAYSTVAGIRNKKNPDPIAVEQEWHWIDTQWYLVLPANRIKWHKGLDDKDHVERLRRAKQCD